MNISDILKSETCNARISVGNYWLIWDDGVWFIYKSGRGVGKVAFETEDEDEAVRKFLKLTGD